MIATNDSSVRSGLNIVNRVARADTITTSAPASFAQSLGTLLQTGSTVDGHPKAKAAADAAFVHAELGVHDPLSLQDPQTLQAEIGTLFGASPAV